MIFSSLQLDRNAAHTWWYRLRVEHDQQQVPGAKSCFALVATQKVHLCRVQAAGRDKAGAEDALVAQDAVGAVLLLVQELAELGCLALSTQHLPAACSLLTGQQR